MQFDDTLKRLQGWYAQKSFRLQLRKLAIQIRHREDQLFLVLTLVIGAVVGLTVVAFIVLTENLGSRMFPLGAGLQLRRLVVPVIGSLVTGFLIYRFFPDARGSGIPQTKVALSVHGGRITLRTVLGKFWVSVGALASGIALGREGPSVMVGSGIASVMGRALGLKREKVEALVPVGAAAALAAAFNTPIAAVLFALEEVLATSTLACWVLWSSVPQGPGWCCTCYWEMNPSSASPNISSCTHPSWGSTSSSELSGDWCPRAS